MRYKYIKLSISMYSRTLCNYKYRLSILEKHLFLILIVKLPLLTVAGNKY